MPRQKLNTLELDAIRPTIPGIGLICTPVIINHLLNKLKREKKKIDHYNHMQQKKAKVITKEKKNASEMSNLNLSILNHRFICPFTAQFSILNIFFVGLRAKFMLHFPFHCNSTYKRMQFPSKVLDR